MRISVILLILILFCGCENGIFQPSVKTITFEGFALDAPSDWHVFTSQGYDSKTGVISDGKNQLAYDLGWYSYNFKNETTDTHIRNNMTINGKDALIVRPKKKGKGIIGVYIQVDSITRFSMYGTSKEEDEILKIFESVRIL